jgi:hypothetical protein
MYHDKVRRRGFPTTARDYLAAFDLAAVGRLGHWAWAGQHIQMTLRFRQSCQAKINLFDLAQPIQLKFCP